MTSLCVAAFLCATPFTAHADAPVNPVIAPPAAPVGAPAATAQPAAPGIASVNQPTSSPNGAHVATEPMQPRQTRIPTEKELNDPGIHALTPTTIKVSGAAVKVGSKIITNQELVEKFLKFGDARFLNQVEMDSAVDQEAKAQHVAVTHEEIMKRLKTSKGNLLKKSSITWSQYLTEIGLSEEGVIDQVRTELLLEKLIQKELTPVNFNNEIEIHEIIFYQVAMGNRPARSEEETKKRAEEVLAEINSGKETFDQAANKFTEDSSGGNFGWISRNEPRLPTALLEAAFALKKVGDVTDPVKLPYGYGLFSLAKLGKDATASEKTDLVIQIHGAEVQMQLRPYAQSLLKKYKVTNLLLPGVELPPQPSAAPAAAGGANQSRVKASNNYNTIPRSDVKDKNAK